MHTCTFMYRVADFTSFNPLLNEGHDLGTFVTAIMLHFTGHHKYFAFTVNFSHHLTINSIMPNYLVSLFFLFRVPTGPNLNQLLVNFLLCF